MATPGNRPHLSVGFILARRFTLCAFANFVDVLRLSADEGDRSRRIHCDWAVLSHDLKRIQSSCGASITPDQRFGEPRRFDYIAVIGGLINESPSLQKEGIEYLRLAASDNVPLIGVCTGAFILRQAGLLDGYRCCVSWFHHTDFLEQFDGARPVSDQIFVVDRDRLTCSGGVSSAHLAAYLVHRHVGEAPARKSLNIMIIDRALKPDMPQPSHPVAAPTEDAIVRRALLLMQQNVSTPKTMQFLARRIGVGRRQLERRFRRSLGETPAAAYRRVRLEHAEVLLTRTDSRISEIAAEAGFADTSHFNREFRRLRHQTPTQFRMALHQTGRRQ